MKSTQTGFALLFFVVVVLGISIFSLSGTLNKTISKQALEKRTNNQIRLKEAKDALLSYSLNYLAVDDLGKLPCPDEVGGANNNGNSDPNCGAIEINSIGYFPYKTVGLGKTVDSSNECLWYIVSGNYKNAFAGDLRNWDTTGFLKIVDENANLQHGTDLADYPIALIISPGKNINQNRNPVGPALDDCNANYQVDEYLEFFGAGVQQQYGVTLVNNPNTEWTFLQPSHASSVNNVDYNDQVIAIYRQEYWDKFTATTTFLDFDNTAPSVAVTDIELLTQSLSQCLVAYGNADANRRLPFASAVNLDPLDPLDEYVDRDNYDDVANLLFGRYPQIIDNSVTNQANFVHSAGISYCAGAAGVTAYNQEFWENWKDHFFMVVSNDFSPNSAVPPDATKCAVNGCVSIVGKATKIAAIVYFSGEAQPNQSRSNTLIDDKALLINYLEGDNQNLGTPNMAFDLTTSGTDYAYCIAYDDTLPAVPPYNLVAIKCANLL